MQILHPVTYTITFHLSALLKSDCVNYFFVALTSDSMGNHI